MISSTSLKSLRSNMSSSSSEFVARFEYNIDSRWTESLLPGTTVNLPQMKMEPPSVSWTIAIRLKETRFNIFLVEIDGPDKEFVLFKGKLNARSDEYPVDVDGFIGAIDSSSSSFKIFLYVYFMEGNIISPFSTNTKNLLEFGWFSDVVLRPHCPDDDFEKVDVKAHKAVLCARSPYFQKLFVSPMKEAQDNVVPVAFHSNVLNVLLNYMYTDDPGDFKEWEPDVLAATDYYGFDKLKSICETRLISRITVRNSVEFLELADRCAAHKLKDSTTKFIASNLEDVIASPNWDFFKDRQSQLLEEVENGTEGTLDSVVSTCGKTSSDDFSHEYFLRFRIDIPGRYLNIHQYSFIPRLPQIYAPYSSGVFSVVYPNNPNNGTRFFYVQNHGDHDNKQYQMKYYCKALTGNEVVEESSGSEPEVMTSNFLSLDERPQNWPRVRVFLKTVFRCNGPVDLVADCKKLLESGVASDVVLVVKNPGGVNSKRVMAHRAILGARSAVFRRLLRLAEKDGSNCNDPVQLEVNVPEDILSVMLVFIYSGQLSGEGGKEMALIEAAKMYELPQLKWRCAERLLSEPIETESVLRLLTLAKKHGLDFLYRRAVDLASQKKEEVVKLPDWQDFFKNQFEIASDIIRCNATLRKRKRP